MVIPGLLLCMIRKTSQLTVVTPECAWARQKTRDRLRTKDVNAVLAKGALAGDSVQERQNSITQDRLSICSAASLSSRSFAARTTRSNSQKNLRDALRCAQCGSDPEAFTGSTDHGLVLHMVQKHKGQQLIQESVAQFRQLDRAACVGASAGVTAKKTPPPRDSTVGCIFLDRRQPSHQGAVASAPTPLQPPYSS